MDAYSCVSPTCFLCDLTDALFLGQESYLPFLLYFLNFLLIINKYLCLINLYFFSIQTICHSGLKGLVRSLATKVWQVFKASKHGSVNSLCKLCNHRSLNTGKINGTVQGDLRQILEK